VIRAFVALLLIALAQPALADPVRIKDLGRFLGWRDNALVGYGIVTGLAGSGDSPRSAATKQALANVLNRMGANVPPDLLQSRNVATVMVTATLPPSANVGDRIDATVTSIGDARSLVGGTLLMTPLVGPDQRTYALAQGALVVGGYQFEDDLNLRQKNYPTAGILPNGATVETPVTASLTTADRKLTFILKDPDFTTAQRIADGLNANFGAGLAAVRGADAVLIDTSRYGTDLNRLIAMVERIEVDPDQLARIVINERSGTVVAGGGVKISSVTIAQGDIKVAVSVDRQASQPYIIGGYAPGASSLIVTNTRLDVSEGDATVSLPNSTVADLAQALARAKVGTRNMIAILQAMKSVGALHADILVQ
jgi:flagellar P-ring protein precursor FlgI